MSAIRAIDDAIKNGSYKQALALSAKALKKQPQLDAAKALQALALHKSGKANAAKEHFSSLAGTTDAVALDCLAQYYRDYHDYGGLNSVYEALCGKAAGREQATELGQDWFFAMTELAHLPGMQKAAVFLQRNARGGEYNMWQLSALLMTSQQEQSSGQAGPLAGALAERMAQKLYSAGQVQTVEELHLVLAVLRHRGLKDEALAVLKLPQYSDMAAADVDLLRLRLDLLHELARWSELFEYAAELAQSGRLYDYKSLRSWLTAVEMTNNAQNDNALEPSDSSRLSTVSRPAASPAPSTSFYDFLHDKHDRNAVIIRAEAQLMGLWSTQVDPKTALLDVFAGLCEKACCFEDVYQLTIRHPLQEGETAAILAQLEAQYDTLSTQARVNVLKLKVAWSASDDGTLQSIFKNALQLTQSSDAVLIASYCLMQRITRHFSQATLIEAAELLESGRQADPTNHNFSIMLAVVYKRLGSISLALDRYAGLKISQIQLDTCAHYVMTDISRIYPGSATSALLQQGVNFYRDALSEMDDMVHMAFTRGAYSHISGFLDVKHRLRLSLWSEATHMEALVCRELARSNRTSAQMVKLAAQDVHALCDNRDFSLLPTWHGWSRQVEQCLRERIAIDRVTVRMRSLMANFRHHLHNGLLHAETVSSITALLEQADRQSNREARAIVELHALASKLGDDTARVFSALEGLLGEFEQTGSDLFVHLQEWASFLSVMLSMSAFAQYLIAVGSRPMRDCLSNLRQKLGPRVRGLHESMAKRALEIVNAPVHDESEWANLQAQQVSHEFRQSVETQVLESQRKAIAALQRVKVDF